MNPSRLVNPSNPFRSPSSAVLSFHARHGHFPDGDRDKVRFFDNVNSSIALMDAGVPEIYTMKYPVYLRDDTVRRIIVESRIKEDRDVTSNRMAELVAISSTCKSIDGELDVDIAKIVPESSGTCDGAHDVCNRKTKLNMDFDFEKIGMIPSCIEKHVGVKVLSLHGSKIDRIEGLDALKNLECLYLDSNPIVKLEGLDGLEKLETLNAGSIDITRIGGLENLVNLKQLNLESNWIEKIENLDALVNLEELDVGSNRIGKIEGLDNLGNLKELLLHDNQIVKLEGLDGLASLQSLILHDNHVTKIEGLDNLGNLKELNLRNNDVGKLENLDTLAKLKKLDLRGTQIDPNECIAFNESHPGINVLW